VQSAVVLAEAGRTLALIAACTVAAAAAAHADSRVAATDPLLAGSLGQFNFVDSGDGLFGGGLEYRWAPLGRWKLIPGVGVTFAEGGAAYGYAALHYDFQLGRGWFVTPVIGAGYFRNTGTLDLGHAVQFKTGLEISVRLADRYRLGLQGYHLSNASLSEDNPGTEVLELVFAIPVCARR
jgi:hypothetical protein